ncbi:hypothetical protein N7530_003908 [Penicillium desertorum]|uniref:Uncharacterized protein n=1 Tax=Penicillium desertorum TaxID=1303715 RepID=A0A9X0BPW6_9EURO|nr:hypothetical protein N7530_003908 [Penicillium desertorum]
MLPVSRPDGQMNFNYIPTTQPMSGTSTGRSSPSDLAGSGNPRMPFGPSPGSIGSSRPGAGSPSHDLTSRLYSKRAREIQAQEGISPSIWGPPTSGHSTPLRENIPESPSQDSFPDLIPTTNGSMDSPGRRARAGTVPSRFPPMGTLNEMDLQQPYLSQTSRPTPSTSPFRPPRCFRDRYKFQGREFDWCAQPGIAIPPSSWLDATEKQLFGRWRPLRPITVFNQLVYGS